MLKNATVHQVRIDSIKPYQNNAKIHGPEQVRKIADSIKEFGFLNPILLDNENMILCGHGRLEAAKLLGMEEVPALYADGLTEAQKRAYILADNRLGELADWDTGLISEELKALQSEGFDIELTGFDVDDILFDESMEPDVEPAPAQEKLPPITKPGEVWKLGDHRLMIGDSADPDQVRKLTGGEPMDLLETDPPYNVDIGITDIEEAKRRRRRTDGKVIAHDAMSDEDFRDFLRRTIGNGLDALKPGGVYYCWHADFQGLVFRSIFEELGAPIRQNIIWVKSSLIIGRQDYQWKHEPCLYGWKPGSGHYFIDLRTLSTVVDDDLESKDKDELIQILRDLTNEISTVQYEHKPVRSADHPTMKPLALIRRQIRNSTKPGDKVLDLFGGSGTTLIACEQLSRVCYTMELSSEYADGIIRRWEEETGKEATKL